MEKYVWLIWLGGLIAYALHLLMHMVHCKEHRNALWQRGRNHCFWYYRNCHCCGEPEICAIADWAFYEMDGKNTVTTPL